MRRIFWGFCRNWVLIDPLHYLSSCFAFGFEFAEIFLIKKRLPDSTSRRLSDSASRGVADSPTRQVGESAFECLKEKLGESESRRLPDSANRGVANSLTQQVGESSTPQLAMVSWGVAIRIF
jgi:hypothetical protein